jgi:modulator of FtsH protease
MLPLREWQSFFSVQASAAATLTGLVFVAVSINLGRILSVPGLPGRAGESLLQFLQVFFISSSVLIPRQPLGRAAAEILAVSVASWTAQTVSQIRYSQSRAGHPLSWILTRTAMSQLAAVPFWVAGILLLLGNPDGLFWLVPGFALSFVAGVISAWVLLIEILR